MKPKQPTPREIRQRAGVSQIQAAVRTDTSEPTVRLYEANPDAIKHRGKREALDAFYASLALTLTSTPPPQAA